MPLTTRTLKQLDHPPNNTHPVCLPHSIFPTFKLWLLPCIIGSPISYTAMTLLMTHCILSLAAHMVPLDPIYFTFGRTSDPLVWHSMSLVQTASPIQLESPHSNCIYACNCVKVWVFMLPAMQQCELHKTISQCFYLSSIVLMPQTTKGPPIMPARWGKEEWKQKRSFHVSSWCFRQKTTK